MTKKVYRLPGQFEDERHGRKKAVLIIAIFIATGLVTGFYFTRNVAAPKQQKVSDSKVATKEPRADSIEGRYLFSGTIVLGRGVEQQAQSAGGVNYAQPFQQIASFNPEQYDGWLADLECPVTNNNVSFRQSVETLQFNCRPEWLPELTKHIKFLNLANNHTNDMGTKGFLETQKNLEAGGVQTIGNFDVTAKQDICEVMALPVRLQKDSSTAETGTLPVAFCAWQYFFRQPQAGELEVMQRYAKVMPVFAFMHSGAEYFPTAAPNQTDIAHKLIDLGGEFVIGNSPHWVQNSEVYKDKLIVYSTGNFIFDQLDSETNRGLNMDVTFKTEYDGNLEKWLKLGPNCLKRGDDCLVQAEKAGLKKISLNYDFAPVASAGGYKQLTRKGDAALQAGVEQRLDWAKTSSQLKATTAR